MSTHAEPSGARTQNSLLAARRYFHGHAICGAWQSYYTGPSIMSTTHGLHTTCRRSNARPPWGRLTNSQTPTSFSSSSSTSSVERRQVFTRGEANMQSRICEIVRRVFCNLFALRDAPVLKITLFAACRWWDDPKTGCKTGWLSLYTQAADWCGMGNKNAAWLSLSKQVPIMSRVHDTLQR